MSIKLIELITLIIALMEHFELDKNCVRFEEESALSIYDFPNAYGRYCIL